MQYVKLVAASAVVGFLVIQIVKRAPPLLAKVGLA